MGLIYRLPLQEDLKNFGLYRDVTDSHNVTVQQNGKVGENQSFGKTNSLEVLETSSSIVINTSNGEAIEVSNRNNLKTNSYININSNVVDQLSNNFSFTLWLRIDSWNINYETYVYGGTGGNQLKDYIFGLIRKNSDTKIGFVVSDGINSTELNCSSETLSIGQWYHIICTYERNKIKLYVNGVLTSEFVTNITPDFTKINSFNLGALDARSYQSDCSICDFRLYSHCLTSIEARLLSQGLVVHFPLNREGFGQDNLATCDTSQYTLDNGYFWINENTLEPNTTYTFSAEIESENVERCTIYNYTDVESAGVINNNFLVDGERHSWTFTTTNEAIGLIGYAGIKDSNTTQEVIYRNIKIEEGRKQTPYVPREDELLYIEKGFDSKIEYDISGFNNDGLRRGVFKWVSDSPKLSVSQYFNGTDNSIAFPFNLNSADGYTIACWIYNLEDDPYWKAILIDEDAERESAEKESFDVDNVIKDIWIHVCITYESGILKIYKNGKLISTNIVEETELNNQFTEGRIGNTIQPNYYWMGKICDVRIYATALSNSDVRFLYRNSKTVDFNDVINGKIR